MKWKIILRETIIICLVNCYYSLYDKLNPGMFFPILTRVNLSHTYLPPVEVKSFSNTAEIKRLSLSPLTSIDLKV